MKRFVAIFLLFVGFGLVLFGTFLVLTGFVTYPKAPVQTPGICWPLVGIGLGMASIGWLVRRRGLSRWKVATETTNTGVGK